MSLRTVEREVQPFRQAWERTQKATMRFELLPHSLWYIRRRIDAETIDCVVYNEIANPGIECRRNNAVWVTVVEVTQTCKAAVLHLHEVVVIIDVTPAAPIAIVVVCFEIERAIVGDVRGGGVITASNL